MFLMVAENICFGLRHVRHQKQKVMQLQKFMCMTLAPNIVLSMDVSNRIGKQTKDVSVTDSNNKKTGSPTQHHTTMTTIFLMSTKYGLC